MLTPILVLMIVSMAYLWLRTHLLLEHCRCELALSKMREEASDEAGRQVDREFREYRRKHLENMVRGLKVRLPCENVTKAESIEVGLTEANLVANAPDEKWIEVPAEETEAFREAWLKGWSGVKWHYYADQMNPALCGHPPIPGTPEVFEVVPIDACKECVRLFRVRRYEAGLRCGD